MEGRGRKGEGSKGERKPTSTSNTSLHATNECVHSHNTAQLDKDLCCEHLWYKR